MSVFEKRVPSPFKTIFCNLDEVETLRKSLEEQGYQIDKIDKNMFCAMIIYHDIKTPTV